MLFVHEAASRSASEWFEHLVLAILRAAGRLFSPDLQRSCVEEQDPWIPVKTCISTETPLMFEKHDFFGCFYLALY